MKSLHQAVLVVLGLILGIVVVESVIPRRYVPRPEDIEPEVECIGQPIAVDFPYMGTIAEPWSCQEQCNDDAPRYILYSNGRATQCETPPGCNDYGEDRGMTCVPPGAASLAS